MGRDIYRWPEPLEPPGVTIYSFPAPLPAPLPAPVPARVGQSGALAGARSDR